MSIGAEVVSSDHFRPIAARSSRLAVCTKYYELPLSYDFIASGTVPCKCLTAVRFAQDQRRQRLVFLTLLACCWTAERLSGHCHHWRRC